MSVKMLARHHLNNVVVFADNYQDPNNMINIITFENGSTIVGKKRQESGIPIVFSIEIACYGIHLKMDLAPSACWHQKVQIDILSRWQGSEHATLVHPCAGNPAPELMYIPLQPKIIWLLLLVIPEITWYELKNKIKLHH